MANYFSRYSRNHDKKFIFTRSFDYTDVDRAPILRWCQDTLDQESWGFDWKPAVHDNKITETIYFKEESDLTLCLLKWT